MLLGIPIRRSTMGDGPDVCNNNNNDKIERLKGEVPAVEFPLYDQEIYFNQVTAGRIFPQPPPQLRAAPAPNWLLASAKTPMLADPCPFGTSSLKHYQTFLGLKILQDSKYVLAKQPCEGNRYNKKMYMKYTYEILSPSGSLIFCKTEAMNSIQQFMSCGLSSYSRPYIAKLIDAWATRTLTIKQNIEKSYIFPKAYNDGCLGSILKCFSIDEIEYLITLESGYIIGTVRRAKKKSKRAPRFYIRNEQDSMTIIAVGKRNLGKNTMPSVVNDSRAWFKSHYSFTFHQLECYDRYCQFHYLGSATKLVDKLTKTQLRDANRYIFKLEYAKDVDIITKLLLLGTCFVIDYDYWRSEK